MPSGERDGLDSGVATQGPVSAQMLAVGDDILWAEEGEELEVWQVSAREEQGDEIVLELTGADGMVVGATVPAYLTVLRLLTV